MPWWSDIDTDPELENITLIRQWRRTRRNRWERLLRGWCGWWW